MDYCICRGLNYNTAGLKEATVIYDIACQYHKHFNERVRRSEYLFLPVFDKFIMAVGKFHLGAHVDDCFHKFSLNFIFGSGQVDGEILETIWAELNKILGSTRSMTTAHRREVIDDFMRDSNWKKMLHISETPLVFLLYTYN